MWRENGYEGRYCRCGSVYTWPEPQAGALDPVRDGHPESFYSTYALFKARWVAGLRPKGRVLEIGCGEGHFLGAAKSLGCEVAGVEPEPERAARVAARLGVEVRCSLLEDLDWPEGRFDIVYHCDLLSHFPDPAGALKKMCGLLAEGGLLAFEVGTLAGIHPFWYRWIGRLGYPQHRWLYSERSLRALLMNAGLRIERARHFGLAPSVALHRSRVLLGNLARLAPLPSSTGSVRARRGGYAGFHEAAYQRIEQFARYRVGALSPRMGPGTWFIAARPVRSS